MRGVERAGRSSRNRGTAFMAAVMMFVLIGCAVVSLMVVFATQARRTRAAVVGPELRQLLMAGVAVAENDLKAHGVGVRTLTVRPPVEGGAITIQIDKGEGEGATARIVAAVRDQRAEERVAFSRDGEWEVRSAVLRE